MSIFSKKIGKDLQLSFFDEIGSAQPLRQLFEHLPGVFFFLKDRCSRMMGASSKLYERLGCASEEEMVGATDYDFFPNQIADGFVRDDQQVMKTGESLINRVEIWYNEQRLLDWFMTTKLPVRNVKGEVIGLMGTVRSYASSRKLLLPYSDISRAVEYIRSNHRQRITIAELSKKAGLSMRQLNRKFQEAFNMSAQEFLAKTRIQAASDALINSDLSITDISLEFGFCDQSAFTQTFRKHIGLTPQKFRQRYHS
ncbi:MAG TPA: AraC family transcriptional regulator [Verrucomicrobiota bacterium]|jgi:AraC-like DNA-binding protein|nr:AraC family transcriptional regulator [Verrucomicrobiota bacterium]